MTERSDDKPQIDRFKEMPRELGYAEDEAAFDEALSKVVQSKRPPKHEPKKRKSEPS